MTKLQTTGVCVAIFILFCVCTAIFRSCSSSSTPAPATPPAEKPEASAPANKVDGKSKAPITQGMINVPDSPLARAAVALDELKNENRNISASLHVAAGPATAPIAEKGFQDAKLIERQTQKLQRVVIEDSDEAPMTKREIRKRISKLQEKLGDPFRDNDNDSAIKAELSELKALVQ